MSVLPLSNKDAEALASFVDPFISAIHYIPHGDESEMPGQHHGTGWLFDQSGSPMLVTCEHVARWQLHGTLAYTCFGADAATSIGGAFSMKTHPVDAAMAPIKKSYSLVQHGGQCATTLLCANQHNPVDGEWFFAYGFPGDDARQAFGTQVAQGLAVFMQEVPLSPLVVNEPLPHPTPDFHISLAWSPEHAVPMLNSPGTLSLPNGMSGSPLWNTRYVELSQAGRSWKPSDARITGMIWGHSAKASQLYATPIEAFMNNGIF